MVGLALCQRQTSNKPEANRILIEAICQIDVAGQLQRIQQVEESLGDRVSGEETLVNYARAELFETGSRSTPALGGGSHRFFGDIRELADVGEFR